MTENSDIIKVEEAKSWEEALSVEKWISPKSDIHESDDEFFLVINLPGVSRDRIKIKIEDAHLIIMGRVDYDLLVSRKYVMQENELGNYFRKFKLSDSVDESKIEARYDNGQLIIKLAKSEKMKVKNIQIN